MNGAREVSFIGFFFSSRRRHTRFDCDWSSDVCSSDLLAELMLARGAVEGAEGQLLEAIARAPARSDAHLKIGRASCRERVEISEVAGSLKKKKPDQLLRIKNIIAPSRRQSPSVQCVRS